MSKRLVAAAAIALALAGGGRADVISDRIAAIPGAVEDVRIGGTWDSGDRSGVFRIVVSRHGGDVVTARLFVQWVAYHADGTATVEDSIEIVEFGDLAVDVDDYTSESDIDGLSVFVRTIDPNGSNDLTYELFVFSPSEYRFGPASN